MRNGCMHRGWNRTAVIQTIQGLMAIAFASVGMVVMAQEKVASDQTQKIAQKLVEALGKPAAVQLTVDADTDRGEAYKKDELGLLVLPDRKLSAEKVDGAGAEPIPVGHLWLKGISPVADGAVIPATQHRTLTITTDDKTVDVAVCLLGARKRDGKLELVLYGSGKTPVLVTPLEPDSSGSTAPIGVTASKENDDTGRLDLTIAGKYKAKILVKRME